MTPLAANHQLRYLAHLPGVEWLHRERRAVRLTVAGQQFFSNYLPLRLPNLVRRICMSATVACLCVLAEPGHARTSEAADAADHLPAAPESSSSIRASDAVTVPDNDVVSQRLDNEQVNADNPYLFTTHKRNFVMPVNYTTALNDERYREFVPELADELQSLEAQFQLSIKVPLSRKDLLVPDDAVYFGFTLKSWWQVYSKGISRPFRETNYQPEFFYQAPLQRQVLGGNLVLGLGVEHQSNGQIQGFSRSWNRLYGLAVYGRGNFAAAIRPWYRLPEDPKEAPDDPRGDDNPDIEDYYGYSELMLGWRNSGREYALNLHGNPATGKGGGEIAVSFPVCGRFRAMVSYFNGYGDSLIDYDHFQQRLGVGILLSNLF